MRHVRWPTRWCWPCLLGVRAEHVPRHGWPSSAPVLAPAPPGRNNADVHLGLGSAAWNRPPTSTSWLLFPFHDFASGSWQSLASPCNASPSRWGVAARPPWSQGPALTWLSCTTLTQGCWERCETLRQEVSHAKFPFQESLGHAVSAPALVEGSRSALERLQTRGLWRPTSLLLSDAHLASRETLGWGACSCLA